MNDSENTDREERAPQAPAFMRPRKPVLDEPLDGVQEEAEKEDPLPESRSVEEPVEVEPTQAMTPASEASREVELKEVEPQPASPYFPHGIYEDAQSVEVYYGRGDREDVSVNSSAEDFIEDQPESTPLLRWGLAALTILLILALMLLSLTRGIPLDLF